MRNIGEVAPQSEFDPTKTAAFGIERQQDDELHCFVADNGVVIWVGDMRDFCDLVRNAARRPWT